MKLLIKLHALTMKLIDRKIEALYTLQDKLSKQHDKCAESIDELSNL